MSLYLGVVYNIETKEIMAVISCPDDVELDNPKFIDPVEDDEKLAMLKVERRLLVRENRLVMDVAKQLLEVEDDETKRDDLCAV